MERHGYNKEVGYVTSVYEGLWQKRDYEVEVVV